MRKIYVLLILVFFTKIYSQKQVFEVPNLKEKIAAQKTVAIIPFDVSINYKKQPKNFSAEASKEQEKKWQLVFRQVCILSF